MKQIENLSREAILSELDQIRYEDHHIRSLATALVRTDSSAQTREVIIEECRAALKADAICLYLLQPRGFYEIIAERGCTQEFKEQWYRLYPEKIPLIAQNINNATLFFGSPYDFKREFPSADKLVDASKRASIAYAPLIVNKTPIGLLGFSYNTLRAPPGEDFAMTLVNLCAQALERARLFELERLSRQEAEAANRAKTTFLSNISHEIRAPLSSIIGFADLLCSSPGLQPNQLNWTSRILQNAKHLSGLVGDVLDLSKIEANKIEVGKHIFPLNEFLEDVKAVTMFKGEEKGVELIIHSVHDNVDILSDAIHLRQILINLIGNAIKFTPRGGKVEVCTEIYASLERSRVRFSVSDTGIGIAKENQEKIFEPFAKVRSGTPGTGLGLSISKELAMALDGDLFLQESKQGCGTTFIVELTCESFMNRAHQPAVARQTQRLQGIKCLVVDDSVDNQIVVKCYLSEEGAYVDTADNGKMGVEKALEGDFDIIVMDIQMPEMDGNRAISNLRASGYTKPVLALTAEVLAVQKEESLQRGFDEYLLKPINRDTLIETLVRVARGPFHGSLISQNVKAVSWDPSNGSVQFI